LAGYVAQMMQRRNVDKILVVKPNKKWPLGKLRRRWEDNIKMYFIEIYYEDVNWITHTVTEFGISSV
jgi:hypothetical protein